MSDSPVSVTIEGDLALVLVDNPPVNALAQAVRIGLAEAVKTVEASDARAAVLHCAGRTFIAGADIREFDMGPLEPHLTEVIAAIEMCSKPWIAAIHGTALGGGLEVALGCHYRVAAPSARMGLPEVTLGILPGAGGTQRLPRIVGAKTAVEMITSGKPVSATKAKAMGLIAEIIEGDLTEGAKTFARSVAGEAPPRIDRAPARPAPTDAEWAEMRAKVEKAAKGQISPLGCFDSIRNAFRLDLDKGLEAEREGFMTLKNSDQSKALRHAFFAERAVAKPAAIKGAAPREINRVAVVGGGLMGSGITTSLLQAGIPVAMIEMNEEAAASGRARVEVNLASAVKRGRLDEESKTKMMATLKTGVDYEAAANADLAIEAVFEDMEVKRKVFANLAKVMGPNAIIASNTSYLDPSQIAKGIENPGRIIGLHFFSPAHIMRLVEVVRTDETAADVIATGFALAKRMGKVAALSGVCDGFIGNRMLASYRRVCDYMMEDMRAIEPIDEAIRAFGMPMGPFQLMDLAGLQIGWATRKRLAPTRDPKVRYVTVSDTLCEAGRFGQKTGAGWYRYEEGSRTPISDPWVAEVIEKAADAAGREKRTFSEDEIQRRAMAALINEGAKILDEGIAARPLDIDMVKIFGYGYPRWRGGPMMHADLVGVDTVLADMERVAADDPGSWTISPLLKRVAESGEGFAKLNK
ncbi:3-hydroxyacyl-CoA dehydrogenase NAD-binding domain-containing protein [Pikeienuella sp. HZG-20]|uniref:3-hydroxyacyl-CoA dehydrogenase NAD-binding domain-containing protein n=1 Tax=Paludibacillus litoralis TaxID=3133267 RepID=UPI0030EBA522